MYSISKQFSFSASHQLSLPYESQCNRLHGHNYIVELVLRSPVLNEHGMVVDYNDMKPFEHYIDTTLDHRHLNEVLPDINPTAENIAKHLYDIARGMWHHVSITVRVSETQKTWAAFGGSMSKLTISEIFGPTVQGEGAMIGKPTVFVRTGGCEYRCSWCDSLYAVLPEYKDTWQEMTTESVFSAIYELSPTPILVTLSGGNPAIQPLGALIDLGHEHGYTFNMETQGTIARAWMKRLDYLTVSPKPPSSDMETRWERLDQCIEIGATERFCSVVLKVVVFDDTDYTYAQEVHRRYPLVPLYLQPGNATPPQIGTFDLQRVLSTTRWLIEKVTQDRWNSVTVLPQLHTLLWQNARGV